MNKYKKIHNDINAIWNGIKSGEYKVKKDVFDRLLVINEDINNQKEKNALLFELSQSVIRIYELMSVVIFDDLTTLRMILNYGVEKDVYFIFNKEAVKIWATKLDWFFSLYNKSQIIDENNDYILLKDSLSSNLCFTANIVLDMNKEIILEKYPNEPTALEFYKSIVLSNR